jgi:hydroxymethylglutaryl-CoA synthase
VVELKQACYSGTAGLRLALPYILSRPQAKVLLIASDVAKYGLNTTGESSQGGGAVAMVLSANPRLIAIDPEAGFIVEDVMDFWRPNYRDTALVEGRFSCDMYFRLLHETWLQYQAITGRRFDNHCRICYHVPIPRLAEKAHLKLARWTGFQGSDEAMLLQVEPSLHYARQTGNCYSASLFLSLISLLENSTMNLGGERLGFYSYGSGSMAEFFSGTVQATYRQVLPTPYHQHLIADRFELDQQEYENFFNFHYPEDGSRFITPCYQTGAFRLAKVDQHKRIYEAVVRSTKVLYEQSKIIAESVS